MTFLVQVPVGGWITIEATHHHAEAKRVFDECSTLGTVLVHVDSLGKQNVLQTKNFKSGPSIAEMKNIQRRAALARYNSYEGSEVLKRSK